MTLLLPLLVFLFVSVLVAAGAMALTPSTSAIERRLGEVIDPDDGLVWRWEKTQQHNPAGTQ